MFTISAYYRPSRASVLKSKPGVVSIRIVENSPETGRRIAARDVNLPVHGDSAEVLQQKRPLIARYLRLLYNVVELRHDSGAGMLIDDIASDFRKALANDSSMAEAISKSEKSEPLRKGIVSIGRDFRSEFTFAESHENVDTDLLLYIRNLSAMFKSEHRTSRARAFASTMSSLTEFCGGNELLFANVDTAFIRDYSEWLADSGVAPSTQSFYLRTLRTILNRASSEHLIEIDSDWFKSVNTAIDRSRKSTLAKALDRSTLLKIERVNLSGDKFLEMVRDMFMFGFYCSGMELIDIANLTEANLRNGCIVYKRRLKGAVKRIPLSFKAMQILSRYKKCVGAHLFPLLDNAGAIQFGSVRNSVSLAMKSIGEIIGYPALSFCMNIGTWRVLTSEINISDALLTQPRIV